MLIKTEKHGDIEVGGDEELSEVLSKVFGKLFDEMYNIMAKETILEMFPCDDLPVVVSIGGETENEDLTINVNLLDLIKDAAKMADADEKKAIKKTLRKIIKSF